MPNFEITWASSRVERTRGNYKSARCGRSPRQSLQLLTSLNQCLNCQCTQSVGVQHFALHHNPWNTYPVENIVGKPSSVLYAEDEIDLSALVGNKEQWTARRCAELRTEGMIIGMRVTAKITICVGDFSSKARGLSRHGLSGQQINVTLLSHYAGFCHVGDHGLHLREWHTIQPIPISELEST
jgi:hypothetical protein